MKKIVGTFLSILMCFGPCISVNAKTDIPESAKSVFTISSASCYLGETVTLDISLQCSEKVNSIALSGFLYDEDALEFIEFSEYDSELESQMYFPVQPDAEKMALTIPLKEASKFDGKLCTMTFKVKASASSSTYTVSAVPLTKNKSDIIESFVIPSEIVVTEKPKKNFTGLSFVSKTYTYDGKEHALAVSGNLPSGTTVEYQNEKASNAGTYNASATVCADGYNDLVLNATLKIDPKKLTVTGLSAQNKTYDATTGAVISGGVLEGVIDGDDVKAVFPTSGQFAKANVGRNISVTIDDIVLEGSAKDNYTLTQPSLKADITAAVLKIKADDKSMATGGSLPELTYTITEGKLFGNDKLSGALSTTANGSRVGTFPITQGTLKASSDYQLTFTGGTLTVVDKTPQNIVVSDITAKTYGDEPFTVTVTPDSVSGLTDMEFSSSDPSVAEIDGQGNVTIKAAGSTVITVKQAGNDEYAPFERKQTLIVNKAAVTVTADAKSKKIGMADPELTYTYTGKLIGNDTFTGALSRRRGETVGKYDILQGTLTLGGNYAITYNKAIFEIFDKTPQNVVVSEITEKTYGDEPFTVTVTPDPESKLNAFTFESSSKAVAEISAEGTVTIKGAGETDITVKEAGNTEYAPFTKTQKLVVKKKVLTVTALNLDEKTVAFDSEAEDCSIDFEKLTTKVTEKADDASMKVTAGNFVLTGAKAGNYTLTTDTFETTVKNENTATVTVLIENGTVTGEGIYVKGSIAELVASTRGDYYFTGWYIGTEKVSSDKTYRFAVTEDTELIAKTVKVEKNGGGATVVNPTCKVRFITDGGSYIADRTVDKYDCVSAPNAPTRDGFTFTGWYTDKETTKLYNFSNKVTSNLTLFAGWKPIAVRKNYTDVSVSDWFDEAVQYVSAKNLMQGVSETEFAPNAPLTRAMFVTILHRMENTPEAQPSSFTDVANDAWYAKAVSWAKANGIVNGVTDTEFAPDETITREQMAAVLYRYAGVKGYDLTAEGELAYADKKDISDYAASAILWMTNKQIMSGDSDVTFAPKNTATRAQAAAVFMRIAEKMK